jgi:steroid 5-alpha reductase family enzyme
MKIAPIAILLGLSLIACPLLYLYVGPALLTNQLETLWILLIIAGASALYCFVVGELTQNNSQMDKLWSLLPEVYLWVIAGRGNWSPRLILMAVLATLWGIRLTFNFARKGAYHLKFWEGREDYRWQVLRSKREFQPRWKWVLFNFFFISLYQNALVLLITLPGLAAMNSVSALNWIDYLAAGLMMAFLIYETIADEEQWRFQTKKHELLSQGKPLAELPPPYDKGFNTRGLWSVSRHPNYLGEQGIWLSFYVFSIAALFAERSWAGLFNWSIIGALLLIVLFLGSSSFAEEISASKYPGYAHYQKSVFRFFPFKKYKD